MAEHRSLNQTARHGRWSVERWDANRGLGWLVLTAETVDDDGDHGDHDDHGHGDDQDHGQPRRGMYMNTAAPSTR
jgi:hypothetical protein